ncbi:MAG: UvrD-helicase domain-containing protein, partial [Flavobacteriales bacterium]|nr:UvrD-helicase domain-containing protein [Flavobacteriales bacterium]
MWHGPEGQVYQVQKLLSKEWYKVRVLADLQHYGFEAREEEGKVMIADFNRSIFEIIRENPAPFIFEKLGEWYHHFLFDEFQDTSILQWQNFLPLIDNALAKGKKSLVVGDGKQAIYRWRNGEVAQFSSLPQIYKPMSETAHLYQSALRREFAAEELEYNWRSAREVVDFNNELYSTLLEVMPELEDEYSKGLKQKPARDIAGFVSVERLEAGTSIEREALASAAVLEKVHACLEDDFRPGDITVLTRGNKEAQKIAEYLVQNEISVVTAEALKLNNSAAVRLIISLAGVLHESTREIHKANFISCLSKLDPKSYPHYDTIKPLIFWKDKTSSVKANVIINKLAPLGLLESMTMYELAEWAVKSFNLTAVNPSFVDAILNVIQSRGSVSPHEFLEWWNDRGDRQFVDSSDATGGVQVMTIHKSKGLEFPVVIYAMMVKQDMSSDFWLEGREDITGLPAVPLKVSASSAKKLTPEFLEERKRQLVDDVNANYVATTRAVNRLHWLFVRSVNRMQNELAATLEEVFASLSKSWVDDQLLEFGTKQKFIPEMDEEDHAESPYPTQPIRTNKNILLEKVKADRGISEESLQGTTIHDVLASIKQRDHVDIDKLFERYAPVFSPEDIEAMKAHVT